MDELVGSAAGALTAVAALLGAFGALLVAISNSRKINANKVRQVLKEIEQEKAAKIAKEKAEAETAQVAENAAKAREQAAIAAAAAEAARSVALESKEKLVKIDGAIFELGKRVDGRLTQLLQAAEELGASRARAALAEGRQQGASDERKRSRPPRRKRPVP